MKRLALHVPWLKDMLPEGIQIPGSTLISGPGGTGKPLVEFAFVTSWLEAGGSLIGIPLQYPTGELVRKSLYNLYGVDIHRFGDRVVMVQFDPGEKSCRQAENHTLMANLLDPEAWDETIRTAEHMLGHASGPGTMVFGSALNLLLFSPTYGEAILKKMQDLLRDDKERSYFFAVSTTVYEDKIRLLEEAADNLMFTRMEKPMRLFLQINRMKGVRFLPEEREVPISEKMLREIKQIAESTRTTRIPEIRKI